MISGRLKVDLSGNLARRIPHLNSDARRRTTAGRIINNGTRRMIREIQKLADAELKERPEDRRRSQGPRYRDSFEVLDNHAPNIDRLEGGFISHHPNARRLEFGTREHRITPRGNYDLVFPWDGPSRHSGPRKPPGSWPVEFDEFNEHVSRGVNHPGTPAFKFVERARRAYHGRSNQGSRRPVSSLK